MALENPLVLVALVALLCGLIGIWVVREYGSKAFLVQMSCVVIALLIVWVSYEVFSLNSWAAGSWWRSLAVFLPPIMLAAGIWVWGRHVNRAKKFSGFGWILLLGLGPGLVTFLPRIPVGSVPLIGPWLAEPSAADPQFVQLLWWALSSIALFVLIPVLYATLFRQQIRSYGLSLSFVKTEVVLFLLVAPVIAVLVWLATADLRFQYMYPFYAMQPDDPNGVTKLLVFEAAYGLSFVALEFFFRGFLVHAGNRVVGAHAVPLMALSYCLIHLGKPLPECLSSLVGGLLLGYVSLRLKSIAVGVVAHLTMAWGTDAAVLWRSS